MRTRILAATALSVTALSATPAAVSSAGSAVFHRTRIAGPALRNTGWSSANWSGYAKQGSGYTSATARWVVPSVSATSKATYSSAWVGIDGFNNSNLIQTGTDSDYYNGAAHYQAWWEILPSAETRISMTVRPGDRMSASISKVGAGTWVISLSDLTRGERFSTTQLYFGPGTSAEWIVEAPSIGGRIVPLAHYRSPDTFDPGTVNGHSPNLLARDGGVLVQNFKQVSTPSAPDADADGFNISYGAVAPAPPAT